MPLASTGVVSKELLKKVDLIVKSFVGNSSIVPQVAVLRIGSAEAQTSLYLITLGKSYQKMPGHSPV